MISKARNTVIVVSDDGFGKPIFLNLKGLEKFTNTNSS